MALTDRLRGVAGRAAVTAMRAALRLRSYSSKSSAPPGWKQRRIAAAEMYRAFHRPQLAGDHIQERRLTGSVGADQCPPFARRDLEVNPV